MRERYVGGVSKDVSTALNALRESGFEPFRLGMPKKAFALANGKSIIRAQAQAKTKIQSEAAVSVLN